MAYARWLALVVWPWMLASYAFASSTPREALVEMVLAEDANTVEKHLPSSFVEAVKRLREPARSQVRSRFVFRKMLPKDVQITVGGVDNLLLSAESKEEPSFPSVQVKVEDEAASGVGTLLKLACCRDSDCENYYVQMKYEDGDWRLARIDSASKVFDLEASVLLRQMQEEDSSDSSSVNESSAVGALRTINTALVQFQANYPDVGFPQELRSLALADQLEADSEHAGLLDASIACPHTPCRRSGYLFDYVPHFYSNSSGYGVSARPEEFGITGTRSFYTDESGIIRFTAENRPAGEDDPPLR